MKEFIGDYELKEPLTNRNAGFSKWGIGIKDGKEYFIKEFLSPVYPEENGELSEALVQKKIQACREYEIKEKKVINNINKCSDGNVLRISEFFRYGTKYYIATERLYAIDREYVYKLPYNEKIRILKVLAHSLYSMHKNNIIHGDMKLDNIIFYRTSKNKITAKIIDVDGSFLVSDIPQDFEDIVVDQVYMAPETFTMICNEEGEIDEKIDVFAMGLIFYQILTGVLPAMDGDTYIYPYEYVLDNRKFKFAVKNDVFSIIEKMLDKNPEKRISMEEVFEGLKNKKNEYKDKKDDGYEEEKVKTEKVKAEKYVDDFFKVAKDL